MKPLSEGGRRMLEIMKEVFTRRDVHESMIERAEMLAMIQALDERQPQGSQTERALLRAMDEDGKQG